MPWSNQLAPLPVVIPLVVAALLAAVGSHIPRRQLDLVSLLTAASVLAICCLLANASSHQTLVYWFGNWHPDARPESPLHFPVGICFLIDPIGAGLAAMVALLTTAAFAFSWSFFEEVKSLYHGLMLTFMAAMCGLCLTGDLFNVFVWFELMTAAAVGLCGYKSEESWPLLGALNFAVVNTVGAFLSLAGVALLYAQTGSLNMAEVGRSLSSHPPDTTFLMIAFLFLIAGFLVKMAVVPFQFWLADAHAVAPTPVCVLFSGVMVELGLYAIARLHWLVFSPAFNASAEAAIRRTFLLMGAATAITGAIYCFGQRHLKRMLAFSTISHLGLMVIGFAMLDPGALSGTAIYLVGHGMIKGTLFLGAGILLHRCGSVDEYDLRRSGGKPMLLAPILFFAALALAGMPPFATFFGQSQIHQAQVRLRIGWLSPTAIIAEALTAGAVLRFTARVFFGWGARQEATSRGSPHIPMDTETAGEHNRTPPFMWVPAVVLLTLAGFLAIPQSSLTHVQKAADHFQQPESVAATVLDAKQDIPRSISGVQRADFQMENGLALAGAFAVATMALFPGIFGARLNWILGRSLIKTMRPLRNLQSGNVGDYVAWFAFGIAAYGALLVLLR